MSVRWLFCEEHNTMLFTLWLCPARPELASNSNTGKPHKVLNQAMSAYLSEPFGIKSTVVLNWATSSPDFSYKTGYGCNNPWLRHSTIPSLLLLASRELEPSSSLNVKGRAGNLVLISLNTVRDACIHTR